MNKMDLILAELQGVNKRLDKVETNQHRHEEMSSQLMQIVGATNGKVSELQKDVAILKEDDARLRKVAKLLVEGQKRQDRILEALSARSFEQETEIKELSRAV